MKFEEFIANPDIACLAKFPNWAISDINKRPLDMFKLKQEKIMVGNSLMPGACVTAQEVNDIYATLPLNTPHELPNLAFKLDYQECGYMVVDIEPSCPDSVKNELLQLPFLYAEYSLSGNGIHLLIPVPDSFYDYPEAINKKVMKEDHKWWEILLDHWVTFTGKTLNIKPGTSDLDKFIGNIAALQRATRHGDNVCVEEPDHDVNFDMIMTVLNHANYRKTPDDFYGDISRYEFGALGFWCHKLHQILKCNSLKPHDYTDDEKIWYIYRTATEHLSYREKHDTARDGKPWLLYLAQEVYGSYDPDRNDKNKKEYQQC